MYHTCICDKQPLFFCIFPCLWHLHVIGLLPWVTRQMPLVELELLNYPSKAPEFTVSFCYSFEVFCVGFFVGWCLSVFMIIFFVMFLTQNFDSEFLDDVFTPRSTVQLLYKCTWISHFTCLCLLPSVLCQYMYSYVHVKSCTPLCCEGNHVFT